MPIIPSLGRLGQKDLEFKASLGYTASLSPKNKTKHYYSSFSKRMRSQRIVQKQTYLLICRVRKHERSTRKRVIEMSSIGRLVWKFRSYSHH